MQATKIDELSQNLKVSDFSCSMSAITISSNVFCFDQRRNFWFHADWNITFQILEHDRYRGWLFARVWAAVQYRLQEWMFVQCGQTIDVQSGQTGWWPFLRVGMVRIRGHFRVRAYQYGSKRHWNASKWITRGHVLSKARNPWGSSSMILHLHGYSSSFAEHPSASVLLTPACIVRVCAQPLGRRAAAHQQMYSCAVQVVQHNARGIFLCHNVIVFLNSMHLKW